jgi:hypothetical protein
VRALHERAERSERGRACVAVAAPATPRRPCTLAVAMQVAVALAVAALPVARQAAQRCGSGGGRRQSHILPPVKTPLACGSLPELFSPAHAFETPFAGDAQGLVVSNAAAYVPRRVRRPHWRHASGAHLTLAAPWAPRGPPQRQPDACRWDVGSHAALPRAPARWRSCTRATSRRSLRAARRCAQCSSSLMSAATPPSRAGWRAPSSRQVVARERSAAHASRSALTALLLARRGPGPRARS